MPYSPHDPQISYVEELDPEPPERTHRWRAWEFALGLALMLGVVGWVGSEWFAQAHKASEYLAAQQSARQHDWEAARAHYRATGGYKDSAAHIAQINNTIDERNRQYALALLSTSMGQWAGALNAAKQVEEIQPGFRSTAELAAQAERGVYRQALSGTVALRDQPGQQGIYYHDGDNWLYLGGSDLRSQVLGGGTPGHAVYDAPPARQGHSPSLDLSQGLPRARDMAGRVVMAAHLSPGKVRTEPLVFDPSRYDLYLWGEKGVWALRENPQRRASGIRAAFGGYDADFQAWGSNVTSTIAMPGEWWAILDFSLVANRVLIGNGGATGDGVSHVVVASPDGAEGREIYAQQGSISSAILSPDGRYALITINNLPREANWFGYRAVELVDIDGSAPPYILATRLRDHPCLDQFCRATTGTFLTRGKLAGKILLADWGEAIGPATFSILDPSDPARPLATATVYEYSPYISGQVWVVETRAQSGVALSWYDGDKQTLVVTEFGVDQPARTARIPASEAMVSWGIGRDNRLILYDALLGGAYSVRAFRLDSLGKDAKLVQVVSGNQPLRESPLSTAWYPGPQMIAYVQGGELHARTYDSTADVTLEAGVQHFFYTALNEAVSLR